MDNRNPLVEEIHATRDTLARTADYDIKKLAEAARARQATDQRPVRSFEPRPATISKKAS